jgi:glycogen debranching enzyme
VWRAFLFVFFVQFSKQAQPTALDIKNMPKQKSSQRRADRVRLSTVGAVVLKDENLYFLAARDGSVPLGGKHALGLFYHDTRYLDGYELRVGDAQPEGLVANASSTYMATFELTNADMLSAHGVPIPKQRIGIKWERIIDAAKLALLDRITFRNFDVEPHEFLISLTFQAGFEDIFIIHGAQHKRTGRLRTPEWDNGTLRFRYKGVDKLYRSTAIHFSLEVEPFGGRGGKLQMNLKPGESKQLRVSAIIAETREERPAQSHDFLVSDFDSVESELRLKVKKWTVEHTGIESDSRLLNAVIERSLGDHRVLRSISGDDHYFAAGLPWFGALFGRDSVIAAIEMLAYAPHMAEQTLCLLARYQGRRLDPSHDEEPGKIHHELRLGELANSKQILQTPYYGTVDATALFLILAGYHAAWTGDLTLFQKLRGNIEAALQWLAKYSDLENNGYVAYHSKATNGGLANQGWKDSGNGIVNEDGSLAEPPIALVEVQGYVYLAKAGLADLYRRAGEPERADQLLEEAAKLRAHFNQDFWLEDKNYYALALQCNRKPAAVISSNPGQALWSGIIDPNRAKLIGDRLMGEDMFNGWGIRTLSEHERSYNPVGYHLGTVWPHDNAIIASGLRKYGLDDLFLRVFSGMVEAASHFEHHRLPELFAGCSRKDYEVPVAYPEACHPQIWAAGAIPMMLQTALGLVPLGFDRRLRIVRPLLPESVQYLEVRRLKVANATVTLRFERTSSRIAAVKVLNVDGDLEVSVEAD